MPVPGLPANGTIYKALIWAIVSLLAWNLWQTDENSKKLVEVTTNQQVLANTQQVIRDVIFELRKEDIVLHQDLERAVKEKGP